MTHRNFSGTKGQTLDNMQKLHWNIHQSPFLSEYEMVLFALLALSLIPAWFPRKFSNQVIVVYNNT